MVLAKSNRNEGQARRRFERDLWQAVSEMAFEVQYQPQIDLRSRRVSGFEALLRWNHPTRGAVPPSEFIPVAERLGLINTIGKWVLHKACKQAVSWPEGVRIAVNVSPAQLDGGQLPGVVAAALRASGLHPSRLELEITESLLLQQDSMTLGSLQHLRALGVRIAIDDFGIGYSSLAYLPRFLFDKIKIDRSFISGLGGFRDRSAVVLAIVRAVVGLCVSLGMTCTAEGVETEEQLAVLSSENCTEVQGHLFSPALNAEDIPALLARFATVYDIGKKHTAPPCGISFFQIAQTANDIIMVTTADLEAPGPTIVYVNAAFTRLTGYNAIEAIGFSPRILQGPGTDRATLEAMAMKLRAGFAVHEKVLNYAKGGAPYWLDMRIMPLRDAEGKITHFAAIERDITLDKRRVDELEFAADRDTLTGIPNRRALLRIIEAEIQTFQGHPLPTDRNRRPCLAFVDVDGFKAINDTNGHLAGDAVLLGLADRLTENVRRSDVVGRVGGEEFAVWMPSVSLAEGRAIAERLRLAVAGLPFETSAGPIAVTVSIGLAAIEDGDSLKQIMQRADVAMYAAKNAGRDRVQSYETIS